MSGYGVMVARWDWKGSIVKAFRSCQKSTSHVPRDISDFAANISFMSNLKLFLIEVHQLNSPYCENAGVGLPKPEAMD